MAYEEKRAFTSHVLSLTDRSALSVSGVDSVGSFDESEVEISTVRGLLIVRGSGLEIEKLNTDTGEVSINGTVDSLEYLGDRSGREGIFSRLFK